MKQLIAFGLLLAVAATTIVQTPTMRQSSEAFKQSVERHAKKKAVTGTLQDIRFKKGHKTSGLLLNA